MGRILTTIIILLLMASTAFADAGSLTNITNFSHTLTPPESDYSVAYLGQIFGTVGNVVQGSSGQMLGKLFSIFNKGVLVVAALWLGYTVLSMSLHGAHEGSFMGQNRNVGLTLLRIAFGFALIVPSSATGYSMLQDIFMKVVVEGVGLADQIWNAGLNYIQYGGQLYIPPSGLSTDPNVVKAAISNGVQPVPSVGFISQIVQDEACMIQSNTWQQKTNNAQSQPTSSSPITPFIGGGSTYVNFQPVYTPPQATSTGSSAGIIGFSGVGGGDGFKSPCGYITAYNNSLISSLSVSEQIQAAEISYEALKQAVISLIPAAQALVAIQNGSQNNTLDVPKTIFSAMVAYMNLITPYQQMLNTIGSSGQTDFINKAEAQGWIMAGGFYWNLEQVNNSAATISISQLVPTGATLSGPAPMIMSNPTYRNFLTPIMGVMTGVSTYTGNTDVTLPSTTTSTIPNLENALWNQYVGAQQNNITASGTTSGDGSSGLTESMSSAMFGNLSGVFHLDDSDGYNPIAVLMDEGNRILTAVVATWIAVIGISLIAAGIAGICASTSPGFLLIKSALTWLKSIIMTLTTALMLPGAILAYYVPMYPFIIFTFAAIGWMAMVVEGMAAAPLVCVGLTHPEGHDFLGKAEQALMLFLGIFLRPGLMIIGLIASMIVSFVAFAMFEHGFGTVLDSLSTGGVFDNYFLVLVNTIMVLLIFGFLTMEVIEQCYKLIYQLPNNIMTWIGGPVTGQDFGQSAKALQGVVGGAGGQMGGAMQTPTAAKKEEGKGGGKGEDSKIETPDAKGGGGK